VRREVRHTRRGRSSSLIPGPAVVVPGIPGQPRPPDLGAALLEAREPVSAAAAMCTSDLVPISGFARLLHTAADRTNEAASSARIIPPWYITTHPRMLGDLAQSSRHTLCQILNLCGACALPLVAFRGSIACDPTHQCITTLACSQLGKLRESNRGAVEAGKHRQMIVRPSSELADARPGPRTRPALDTVAPCERRSTLPALVCTGRARALPSSRVCTVHINHEQHLLCARHLLIYPCGP
jgi:hypothetical protein